MEVKITIIRTKNLSARAIHVGMWLWCIIRRLKPCKTYNHCEVRYGDLTSGAIADGVKTRLWPYYVFEHRNKYFRWINYALCLTEDEFVKGFDYLKKVEDTPYEFANFWHHVVKTFTGKWDGSRTEIKLYCYEHGIRFLNATGKYKLDPFMNPYEFKLWADHNLK